MAFDERSKARIGRAVRRLETSPSNARPGRRPRGVITPDFGLRVHNVSGEIIPPFACVHVTGIHDRDSLVMKGDKPSGYGSQWSHYFNGRDPVPIDSAGFVSDHAPVLCAYDPGEDADNPRIPALGESWGPLNDSWLLHWKSGGWLSWGGPIEETDVATDTTNTLVYVRRQPLLQMEASLDEPLSSGGDAQATPVYRNGSVWARHEGETITVHDARGLGGIANAGAVVNVYWEPTLAGWVGVSRGCTFEASS